MTARERWEAQMGNSIAEIARAMGEKKRKREMDLIAQEVAEQYGLEGIDSAEELKMAMALQEFISNRDYKKAMADAAKNKGTSGPGYVQTEYGMMTPYQAASLSMRAPEQPENPDPLGLIWNGKQYVKAPEEYIEKQKKIPEIEAEVAELQAHVDAKNEHIGPDWLGLGASSSSQLKKKQAERDALKKSLTPVASPNRALTIYKSKVPPGAVVAKTPEEAEQLPPGTVFYTPDGRRKVRP